MPGHSAQDTAITISSHSPQQKVVVVYFGDMHANTLKMLIGLSKQGIISNLNSIYQLFYDAYRANNLKFFFELVDQLKFDSASISSKRLCYIGDMLSDRGQNDAFTLYLLYVMNRRKRLCYIGDMLSDRGQNDAFTLYLLYVMNRHQVEYKILY